MEMKWALQLLHFGGLRVSLLEYYTDMETLGDAVGDDLENRAVTVSYGHTGGLPCDEGSGVHFFGNVVVGNRGNDQLEQSLFGGSPNCNKNGNIFVGKQVGDPKYTYCASVEMSRSAMVRMSETSDSGRRIYDACIEITDAQKFVEIVVSKAASFGLNYYWFDNCKYVDGCLLWDEWAAGKTPRLGFIKNLKYAWQKEARLLLVPSVPTNLKSHIDLEAPELKEICRLVPSHEIPA